MKTILLVFILALTTACSSTKEITNAQNQADFTLAFGSCNKASLPNLLWDDVLNAKPDVWVWGGDIIYADTEDMGKLKAMYASQDAVPGYKSFRTAIPVIGTWDDHDYGVNDGGVEFKAKKESQVEFLDFMKVPANSPRRMQEGVYNVHDYNTPKGSIKVIVLDTRYFRTALTPDTETKKRNKPNKYGEGTVLGSKQWKWLTSQLKNSNADFNIIVSSIQVLSNEHGFECWGNFPHEVDKLKTTIADSNAKGVLILSGDRHISEFSRTEVENLNYPLIDFTSSGLTHAYNRFQGESNPFREGKVVSTESFGLLQFNFEKNNVTLKMVGDNGKVLGSLHQSY
ncbi:alkaline phosphatase family protein [Maribacter sp. MJ134]|uniref:alkaline phosphatase D family protein n=1 Tax=Maribacter sp. MJ134 TaxID=2496865 RepID=UPI000F843613|nr:alkaline phosphatase D family protein [Maribacter sp. MJ134]AZQ58555.1 alkaline phosphatase family protein [Maribacter sp. MJ134]